MLFGKKEDPEYPYDETVGIQLPEEIEREIRALVKSGRRVEAVRKVFQLTKAGLKISKDYVDGLSSD